MDVAEDSLGAGGVEFSAWHGECNQRDMRYGLRVLFWASRTEREVGQAEPGRPQAREYGGGPRERRNHALIGSVPGAFPQRNAASCRTCSLPPFRRERPLVTDPVRGRQNQETSDQDDRATVTLPIGITIMMPRMVSVVDCEERKALDAQRWSHPRSNQ